MKIECIHGFVGAIEEKEKVCKILLQMLEVPEDVVIRFWDENHLRNFANLPRHTLDKIELDEQHPILQVFVLDTLVYAGQPLKIKKRKENKND
ncbi:hypothetical protein ACFSJM_06920 [Lactococcus formosensis subsp. bovis]|uniref:hypothetical protein n=1 Tax=Lactococcus formosensis TaxID=1281486 RepID=UPI001BCB0866|nr:hypothetical protein [Lactococcus formosensis]